MPRVVWPEHQNGLQFEILTILRDRTHSTDPHHGSATRQSEHESVSEASKLIEITNGTNAVFEPLNKYLVGSSNKVYIDKLSGRNAAGREQENKVGVRIGIRMFSHWVFAISGWHPHVKHSDANAPEPPIHAFRSIKSIDVFLGHPLPVKFILHNSNCSSCRRKLQVAG